MISSSQAPPIWPPPCSTNAQQSPPAKASRLERLSLNRSRTMLTKPGSGLTASMLRDIERGLPIEGAHVISDLLQRGQKHRVAAPLLRIADAHLRAYETRRMRETGLTRKTIADG